MIVTNSRANRELMRCALPMGAVLRLGGSKSSTSSSSEVRDQRVVGGDNSTNISANDSAITVYSTDQGAVAGGLALASQSVAAVTKNGDTLQASMNTMFEGVLKSVNAAYSEARAPDANLMKIAAVAAVLVVGLIAYMGKKG